MRVTVKPHPIQDAIEAVRKRGNIPRLQINAHLADVPEAVRKEWGVRLVIDLDSAWPMNLEYVADGVEVDLAFTGYVMRCKLPWEAIYVVLDRSTGKGLVIEAHLPTNTDLVVVPSKVWKRVQDLLRLADDQSTTSAERQQAWNTALKLAAEHKIDLTQIRRLTSADGSSVGAEAARRRAGFKLVKGGKP